MTLEFNRIINQVMKLGAMLDKLDFDISETMDLARERFYAASDLGAVWERIEWVRQPEVSGYRGAAPLDLPNAEAINSIVPEPALPPLATVLAVDGSQVYPDEQAPVHYYLLNIGQFLYPHGMDHTPEQLTFPELRYHKDHVHDRYGRIIRNSVVDDRRTVAEMQRLAESAWQHRGASPHLLALYDNRLMYQASSPDPREVEQLTQRYMGALVHLHDSNAILAGYIDNPYQANRVMRLLYLLSLNDAADVQRHQADLVRAGDLEGLRDFQFFSAVLKDGERSAIMVQNSPQNKTYRDKGENYEIAFFYMKVYNAYQSKVVRVDLPVWVARDRERVDALHALLIHQCKLQGRNPYPYAITRADELAVVTGKDRDKLEELINVEIRRVKQDLVGRTLTAKSRGKELARSEKRYFNMRGQEFIDRE